MNTKRFQQSFSIGSAVSSVVEHYLDTVGVTGSKPVSRTIPVFILFLLSFFPAA
jgi:hypothetical protein